MTDGIGDAHRPAFSSDGSALYFLGSTNAGKAKTGLDLSVLAHMNDVSWSIYQVHLSGGGIERLPIPAARYVDLKVAADGALFLTEDPGERTFAGKRRLGRFDPGTQKIEPFLADVDEFELSANGKRILYRSDSAWGIVPIDEIPAAGAGKIDLASLEVAIDPQAEWRQIFRDAWRAQRDFFYDEKLHGVDWEAMRERYEAWLPDLRHRSDLNYVLSQLVGELVNSHIAVGSPRVGPWGPWGTSRALPLVSSGRITRSSAAATGSSGSCAGPTGTTFRALSRRPESESAKAITFSR